MEEIRQFETAIALASDLAKQLITVASAVLVLTVTLVDRFYDRSQGRGQFWLAGSWALLVLSILAGIWALSALTGHVAPLSGEPLRSIGTSARGPAGIQAICFAAGILSFMLYGLMTLRKP